MKPLSRVRAACMVGVILVLAAGCTTTTADGPTTTNPRPPTASASVVDPSTTAPTPSVRTSPSPSVVDPPSPTSASLDPAAREAADRAAIEAQWRAFWNVYENIVRTPGSQRPAALDAVSLDPIKSEILDAAQRFESDGIDYYGSVVHYPYWSTPVDGQEFALLRDCMDQSDYGSVYVASGEKRSSGVEHDHIQAGFVRGTDGIWRVQNIQYIADVPC